VAWHGDDELRFSLPALLVLTLSLGYACGATAVEPALGRVVSLDADAAVIAVDGPGSTRLRIPLSGAGAERGLRVGGRVRVWRDDADATGGGVPRLSPIGARDLTGVRGRLSRGAGRGGIGDGVGRGGRPGGFRGGR
jgi:hypothetical protein